MLAKQLQRGGWRAYRKVKCGKDGGFTDVAVFRKVAPCVGNCWICTLVCGMMERCLLGNRKGMPSRAGAILCRVSFYILFQELAQIVCSITS